VSRDPIGRIGGANDCAFNRNDAIGKLDADGRVTITRGSILQEGVCGGWGVYFVWNLDNPTIPPDDGFLVQKVERGWKWRRCREKGKDRDDFTEIFWEEVPWKGPGYLHRDLSSSPDWDNRYGAQIARGEVKYFSKHTTGDLEADPNWRNRGQVWVEPLWWSKPSDNNERTAERVVDSGWVCCCGMRSSNVRCSP